MRGKSDADWGLIFFAASDDTIDTDHWFFGFKDGWKLSFGRRIGGVDTIFSYANATSAGYTIGEEGTLLLRISIGKVTGTYIPDGEEGTPANWSSLTLDRWSFTNANTQAETPPKRFTVGAYARVTQEAKIYEVSAGDGAECWNVGTVLTAIGEVAGCGIEVGQLGLYEAEDEWPFVSSLDCNLYLGASGDGMYMFAGSQQTSDLGNALTLTIEGSYAYCGGKAYPYSGTISIPGTVRVVAYDKFISIYQSGRLLTTFYNADMPSSGVIGPIGTDAYVVLNDLYWPVEAVAWDQNQPGSSPLGLILERRRVFMIERGTGVTLATTSFENGDLTTDPTDGIGQYRRCVITDSVASDARGNISLVGVLGADANTLVYLLDTEAAQYGSRAIRVDSPWCWSEQECIDEAQRVLLDNQQQRSAKEIDMFFDPGMEIRDYFGVLDTSGNETQWIVQEWSAEFAMTSDGFEHKGHVVAVTRASMYNKSYWQDGGGSAPYSPGITPSVGSTPGHWGTGKWG
jgi:hypothetical protein